MKSIGKMAERATRNGFGGILVLQLVGSLLLVFMSSASADKAADLKKFSDETLDTWVAPSFLREQFPWYVSGTDKANRTVFVVEFGKWDLKSMVEEGGMRFNLMDRYVNQALFKFLKYADKWIKQNADNIDDDQAGAVLIMNMEGYSLMQMASTSTIRYVMEVTRRFLALEDKLAYGYFTNVNFLANGLIRIIRPILGSVMDKVEVLNTNKESWIPKISEKIPLSQLPPSLGGPKNFQPLMTFR